MRLLVLHFGLRKQHSYLVDGNRRQHAYEQEKREGEETEGADISRHIPTRGVEEAPG